MNPAMVRRVVLTGSECTGKTTLARLLAHHYRVHWVPEQSRHYAEQVARTLTPADVEPIARAQLAAEESALTAAAHSGESVLILDTDLVSTVVYARHYYGHCPEWVSAAAASRLADLYLLCDIDIPWTADAVRDRPHARMKIHAAFRDILREFGARNCTVSGFGDVRLASALHCIASVPDLAHAVAGSSGPVD